MCGRGTEWTDRLDYALGEIETDHLVMLCDDYLLCDRIDNAMILKLLTIAETHGAGNLRMGPNPAPSRIISPEAGIGEYGKGMKYRITTQAGIWRTDYLRQFSGMHTSIWGFERMGSEVSNQFPQPILATLRHVFPFEDAIHKGRWERAGIRLCDRNNIPIDRERRQLMREKDYFIKHAKGVIIEVAPSLVTKGMNFATRVKRAMKSLRPTSA